MGIKCNKVRTRGSISLVMSKIEPFTSPFTPSFFYLVLSAFKSLSYLIELTDQAD